MGSSLWVTAITFGAESGVYELSSGKLPREVTTKSSLKKIAYHVALKSIVYSIVSPFWSAHVVESVQVWYAVKIDAALVTFN